MVEDHLITTGKTLGEAASAFQIDEELLQATVVSYSADASSGTDHLFGRTGSVVDLTDGPYYLQRVVPSVHHTMGGIAIDSRARVLNGDKQVIVGLYAAGEAVGGVHGTNRLGGNAITDCVVFGRIAGANAAAE